MAEDDSILLITSADPTNTSFGTGFVIYAEDSADDRVCYVVTCWHVVDKVKSPIVRAFSKKYKGELVSLPNPGGVDLAVLKVVGLDVPPLTPQHCVASGESAHIQGYREHGKQWRRETLSCELSAAIELVDSDQDSKSVHAWKLDITSESSISDGYSGSPIIDPSTAAVVAVANTMQNPGRIAYAIAIAELSRVWKHMPSHLSLSVNQSEKIPFVNRKEERNQLAYVSADANSATLYFVVDAPLGYGKSALLEEVRDHYKNKEWVYGLVQMPEESTTLNLANALCNHLEFNGKSLGVRMTAPHNGGSYTYGQKVGDGISQKFNEANPTPLGKGLVLLIDLDGNPNEDLANALFTEFIPDFYKVFEKRTARRQNRDLKFCVIVAGRGMFQLAAKYNQDKKLPLTDVVLSPFKYADVRESAEKYFKTSNNEIDIIAGVALCLGAGHPQCMAHIFRDIKNNPLPVDDYLKLRGQFIWDTVVAPKARAVFDQMNAVISNSDMVYLLSLFRYVDYPIMQKIIEEYSPHNLGDAIDLDNKLVDEWHLLQRNIDLEFIGNSILRRLITLNLCFTDHEKFTQLSRKARSMCIDNLAVVHTRHNHWVIEYLFLCVQEYMGHQFRLILALEEQPLQTPLQNPPAQQLDHYRQFMDENVQEIVAELKAAWTRLGLSDRDRKGKKTNLLKILEDPREQWELRFVVNFHLRQDFYTDNPFQDLRAKIENLL